MKRLKEFTQPLIELAEQYPKKVWDLHELLQAYNKVLPYEKQVTPMQLATVIRTNREVIAFRSVKQRHASADYIIFTKSQLQKARKEKEKTRK